MSVFCCIVTLLVFPQAAGSELIVETSLNALTFTPRWSIEPYPGYQGFLANKLKLSHAVLCSRNLSLGVEIGVANRFHFTYFESYAAWGLDDTKVWLMGPSFGKISLLARMGLPTGLYDAGIGQGAYWFEIYAKKARIICNSSVCIGYEWIGANPDKVNYGDRIHLGLEIFSWFGIRFQYAFPDHGTYYSLNDSPSFAAEISLSRNFNLSRVYNLALAFNQTVLGKDIPVSTSVSLKISGK